MIQKGMFHKNIMIQKGMIQNQGYFQAGGGRLLNTIREQAQLLNPSRCHFKKKQKKQSESKPSFSTPPGAIPQKLFQMLKAQYEHKLYVITQS